MLESQCAIIDARSAIAIFGGQRRLKFFSKKWIFFSPGWPPNRFRASARNRWR
jgi:hypothetical protein